MAEASVSFAGNLAATLRRHARDPHRPLITLGFSLG
jgi:hypothetical protein